MWNIDNDWRAATAGGESHDLDHPPITALDPGVTIVEENLVRVELAENLSVNKDVLVSTINKRYEVMPAPHKVMVVLRGISGVEDDAQQFARNPVCYGNTLARAIVSTGQREFGILEQHFAQQFLRSSKADYPQRIFGDEESARRWLRSIETESAPSSDSLKI